MGKYLVIATDVKFGETLFCRRDNMMRDYQFAASATPAGRASAKHITRERATEFGHADACETLLLIESRFGHLDERYRWIKEWRVVPASYFPKAA